MRRLIFGLMFVSMIAAAAQAVTIETVPVGNLGNAADDTGYGSVSYAYNIGKYEVTAGQYTEFLNAVAKTDAYGLYNPTMNDIIQSGTSGSYSYSVAAYWANRPVNLVSWGDTTRFANWLHNGQPTGAQDSTTTEDGAYNLSGTHSYYNPDGSIGNQSLLNVALMAVNREADWKWAITSEDEWYKAAYYDPEKPGGAGYWDYPMKSDAPDVPSNDLDGGGNNATFLVGGGDYTIGSPYYRTEVGAHENSESPYDTFDQGGNLWEWNERADTDLSRGLRGGSWYLGSVWLAAPSPDHYNPVFGHSHIGFRVVQIPEPTTITLLLCGLASLLWCRRRK